MEKHTIQEASSKQKNETKQYSKYEKTSALTLFLFTAFFVWQLIETRNGSIVSLSVSLLFAVGGIAAFLRASHEALIMKKAKTAAMGAAKIFIKILSETTGIYSSSQVGRLLDENCDAEKAFEIAGKYDEKKLRESLDARHKKQLSNFQETILKAMEFLNENSEKKSNENKDKLKDIRGEGDVPEQFTKIFN